MCVTLSWCRCKPGRRACRLPGFMEIRRNTTEKGRKEEEERGMGGGGWIMRALIRGIESPKYRRLRLREVNGEERGIMGL